MGQKKDIASRESIRALSRKRSPGVGKLLQQVAAVFDVEVSTLTKGRRGKNEPWSQRGDISKQATVGSAVARNGAVGLVYAQVRSQQTTD